MRKIKSILACLGIAVLLLNACDNKADNPTAKIAGSNNKTWHPVKETNSEGDKEKLTDQEEKEAWVFYTNGTMAMNLTTTTVKGNWIYDGSSKTLTITPDDGSGSKQFTVEDLTDDKMKLKAADGSELKLDADD
jgi:hypothetical protein